jgi:hypothetical protein
MPKTIWDIEGALDAAKDLRLKDGFSFGRIADVLTVKYNCAVSRNSVIGKFSRMGIAGGPARPMHRKTMKPRTTTWGGRSAFLKASPPKPKNPVQAAILGATEPLPDRRPEDIARISFAELDEKVHCKFIPGMADEGDPLHAKKYCGLPPAGAGLRYCIDHLRRCHQPLPTASNRPFVLYKPGVRTTVKEDA